MTSVVRQWTPSNNQQLIGAIHILLMEQGAELDGVYYRWKDEVIRLIEGSGQILYTIMDKFADEPHDSKGPSITVCIGAIDSGGHHHLVRSEDESIVRKESVSGNWITHNQLFELLGV